VKTITVGNAEGHYQVSCNSDHTTCITPMPGADYFVFRGTTRWKFPGGTEAVTLEFFQDFSIKYNEAENIALVPDGGTDSFGMFWLVSWSKDAPN
jgi:hypothetical protein